jgi:hypothetical protein
VRKLSPHELQTSAGGDRLDLQSPPGQDPRLLADALATFGTAQPAVDEAAGRVILPVADGAGILPEFASRLAAAGLHVASLALRRPTLEEAFLAYTGPPAEISPDGTRHTEHPMTTVTATRTDVRLGRPAPLPASVAVITAGTCGGWCGCSAWLSGIRNRPGWRACTRSSSCSSPAPPWCRWPPCPAGCRPLPGPTRSPSSPMPCALCASADPPPGPPPKPPSGWLAGLLAVTAPAAIAGYRHTSST